MATPVAWRFGPWATGTQQQAQQAPSQSPYASMESPPDLEQSSPYQDLGGTGRGGPGITATAESGPMTAAELGGLWGGTAARRGIGMGIGAIMGQTPSMSSMYGAAPLAGVTLGSVLSSIFGGIRETDPEFGIATPNDIQDMTDYGGQMKGQAMAAEAKSQRASVDSMQKDIAGVNQPDWNGMNGGNGDPGDTGGPSPGDSPGSHSGGGEAKGGAYESISGKPQTRTFGERGPEAAIYIPTRGSQFDMTRPGRQGNETDVIHALRKYLMALNR